MIRAVTWWRPRAPRASRLLGLLGLLLGLSAAMGCGGAASSGAQLKLSPDRDAARREVAEHRGRIESLLRASPTSVTSDTAAAGGACGDTCGVAEDLCASTEVICQLAGQHAHDPEMRATCVWAEDECAQARSRCQACGGRGR